ncbi:NADH-quinone oxidoreductase subunit J [Candidatus Kinetoplastibacterium sorsogonicusi]|uniref:NADH-quinone oxidoreductase subunit J n=1 Tax=Candidatus Kinetoplastidibacterium kentomonadis TaxID=1576550 RepID=A0A3Q8ERR7_9PROT|nr:NADH-quinone oxidoreductase subunit J [Candidatus Kinetoplastibacterium sorsogonicusi]AWD32587.1 NADH-quinone oxidoreductase subunit J [Candidatus Kinetoplastibacterium sorsogonicusi]
MNINNILFYIVSFFLLFSSCIVITSKQLIISLLFLILVFINTSILWMTLGAEFLSLLLIVVYVGAVLVLFLFAIMLINNKVKNCGNKSTLFFQSYKFYIIILAVIIFLEMITILSSFIFIKNDIYLIQSVNNTLEIGKLMYSKYVLAIELGAIILFVGMIAVISLTIQKNKKCNVKYNDIDVAINTNAKDRLTIVKDINFNKID